MLRIKQSLVSAGLRVAAYKGATFSDIAGGLSKDPRNSLAIIFLKNDLGVGQFGHYMALLDGGPKGLFVADVGGYVGWESLADLNSRLRAGFSGLVMFVTPGGAPTVAQVFPLDAKQVSLRVGEIAAGPGLIHIPFLLQNTARKPIRIAMARGTCYCFRGATIEAPNHAISPGRTGTIVLKFKRSVIGIGNIEREVLFRFANGPKHVMEVVVHAHITATYPPIQLTWYPSQIDLGVVRRRSKLSGEEFTVLVPKGISLRPPICSSRYLSVIAVAGAGGAPQTDDFGRTVRNYVIDLAKLPKGFVNDKITILSTDKHVPKIVIPITGQVDGAAANVGRANH